MFKKKPKANFDIGIEPIEHEYIDTTEKPKNSKSKLILKIVGVVLLLLVALVVVTNLGSKDQAPDDNIEKQPTDEPVELTDDIVEGDPTETPSDVEPTEPSEPTDTEVESPPDVKAKTPVALLGGKEVPEGYVLYTNGLLNLTTVLPSSWIVEEKTNESIEVIKKALESSVDKKGTELNLKKDKFTDVVKVVDFVPNDEYQTRIAITILPKGVTETIDPKNKVFTSNKETKSAERTINKTKYTSTSFKAKDYDVNLRGLKVYIKNDLNTIIVSLSAQDSEEFTESEKVVDKVVELMTLNEGA